MQDSALLQAVSWLTERVTEGPMQKEHPGRFDCDGQFAHHGERDRCHPAGFDFPCEQSHGPRADGSSRDQEDEVDVRIRKPRAKLMAWEQQIVRILGKAEAVVRLGDVADDALGL